MIERLQQGVTRNMTTRTVRSGAYSIVRVAEPFSSASAIASATGESLPRHVPRNTYTSVLLHSNSSAVPRR